MKRFVFLCALASACDATDVRLKPDFDLNRMIDQPRADAYEASNFFPDGKVLQAPPEGTVPHEKPPAAPKLSDSLLARGRNRYDIFCATCHGILGDGDSAVSRNMPNVKPRSLQEERIRAYPLEQILRVATEGYGVMNGYSAQLDATDRWAVAAYVKALQASQHVDPTTLSVEERSKL